MAVAAFDLVVAVREGAILRADSGPIGRLLSSFCGSQRHIAANLHRGQVVGSCRGLCCLADLTCAVKNA